MISDSGRTVSVWMKTVGDEQRQRLREDVSADVCVVGAGMAGISTAYQLTREGKRVVVLDDGPVAGGNTCRTTAHLAFYIDDGLTEIERLHGTDGLKLAVESHSAAVDRIEQIAREEGIDCDFLRLDGYLFVSPNGLKHDFLKDELDAARRIGWDDCDWADRAPIPFDTGRCLRFPRHGQFHPTKWIAGVARAVERRGGQVYTGAHAADVEKLGDGRLRVVSSAGPAVTAGAVVFATNTPVNDRVVIHTKQEPWRTYVVGLRVPKGSVPPALYWDTEDPYHYVRTQPMGDYDLLITGGEDHKTGHANDPDQRYARLERWTRERFPMCERREFHWSGQWMEPIDYLAYSGRNPGDENVYIHTGDSGHGITHGMIAGVLLTDLIAGRPNPWEKLYDPSRLNPKAAGHYAQTNVSVAAQYRDYVTPGQVSDVSEIAPRQGAVVRRGLAKVAVYKDEFGQTHECSAVCTHMQCLVRWNYAEGSWDCPCHGSRFDPYGRVIDGPANSDLGKA